MILNSYIALPLAERSIHSDSIAFTLHFLWELLDGSFWLNFDRLASSESRLNGFKVREFASFIFSLHILYLSQFAQVSDFTLLSEKAPYHVLVWLGTLEVGVCLRAIV